ncbi:preprotein translocase subunit SecA [Corynebacterium hindlerae]|uniref:DUF5926 family protein n=1 Tax=Corynebacterium hindlerae TaxID=699041 RepID=UPI001AD6B723|nr:DUF5926 family protein [Corynebacterium hindlerae]QTH60018.1 preprotein translocase subunit SecA [Corynebacterium hindlerae]
MAKKKKKDEQLPEGMSRRQAKLAARAAERAALERDPRPYGELAMEADLVALQEFVPSAFAKLPVKGFDRDVYVATVLPGAAGGMVQEDGTAYVALQTQSHTHNPGRDLAYALAWARDAKAGATLASTANDGTQPSLTELLDASGTLDVQAREDFNWWLPSDAQLDVATAQSLKAANDTIMPSYQVTGSFDGVAWWIDPGEKAHIRWVRRDDEDKLMRALARISASGALDLGENTKFAGVFRTHGIAVPVWDLPVDVAYETYGPLLEKLDKKIAASIEADEDLSPEARRALENIKSRQVTIR